MTLLSESFETGGLPFSFGTLIGDHALVTTDGYKSSRCLHQASNQAQSVAVWTSSQIQQDHQWATVRMAVKILDRTQGTTPVLILQNNAGGNHFNLFIPGPGTANDGKFQWDLASTDTALSDFTVELGRWYDILVRVYFGGASYLADVWIDGEPQTSIESLGQTPSTVRSLRLGTDGTSDIWTRRIDELTLETFATIPPVPDFTPDPLPVSLDELREEVGAGADKDRKLLQCLEMANDLVTAYLEDNLDDVTVVPASASRQAVLVAAVDLFNQSQAPHGIVNQQYDAGTGDLGSTPIRITRDPLNGVYPTLRLWVTPAVG